MKHPSLLFILSFIVLPFTGEGGELTRLVNPFVGTDGHGHTFPGATLPFGMVQLSPDTRVEGWDACSGYHYSDTTLLGFSHTHLSGTGVADYGDILFTPFIESPRSTHLRHAFRHSSEKASPGYYSVLLHDADIRVELTATNRVGVHRYIFPKTDNAGILINLVHGLGPDRVIESALHISGKSEVSGFRRSEGWASDQKIFFVAHFSKPFSSAGIWINDTLQSDVRNASGTNIKGMLVFTTRKSEPVIVKVGISSVSIDGARNNLEAEVPDWDFDGVRNRAAHAWENELGKIRVEGGSQSERRTFYTALYHSLLAPNILSDVDGSYRGMDGNIYVAKDFTMYTVFSLWDTFRAGHPLLSIIDQTRTLDFVKSLLAKYDESGILPVWELASNETWCMIGYHAVPVIADAYVKGIVDFDAEKALAAMVKSATRDHFGLKQYREHGFIPADSEAESVSKTLEYAYDDWCIAQMAQAMGKQFVAEEYLRRAQSFENLFDASTGFMRGKQNGAWVSPFDPTAVTFHYTEANAWQYNFFVPHNITRLMELHGGGRAFVRNLDSLFFTRKPVSGRSQADVTGLIGQYAQGNEPSHHVAYLYNYAGSPWKTQNMVRLIMEFLYSDKPDGLSGNDDCGQMSAWYVMSAIGFYQVCPGQPLYTLGSPIFNKAIVRLENGKKFTISAPNNSPSRRYIESARLNGKPHTASFITHQDIMDGGELELAMNERPETTVGDNPDSFPRSLPQPRLTAVPYVTVRNTVFSDSVICSISTNTEGALIYFTLGGADPTEESDLYHQPLKISENTTLRAVAVHPVYGRSAVMDTRFTKKEHKGAITLNTMYSQQYTGGGDNALLDGVRGGQDFRLGGWQGFHGNDLDAVVDLERVKEIDSVGLGCLQDINSWIFFPTEVQLAFSQDGKNFSSPLIIPNAVSQKEAGSILKTFVVAAGGVRARYVRILARNIGQCPEWHKGAGNKAWLFADEIMVNTK